MSPRRLKKVSNETPKDVLVVRYQKVSVVRIHDVPLPRLYDVSCKSQIKHPKMLLWYVSTTSQSFRDVLIVGLYTLKLLCHNLHLVVF